MVFIVEKWIIFFLNEVKEPLALFPLPSTAIKPCNGYISQRQWAADLNLPAAFPGPRGRCLPAALAAKSALPSAFVSHTVQSYRVNCKECQHTHIGTFLLEGFNWYDINPGLTVFLVLTRFYNFIILIGFTSSYTILVHQLTC